MRIKDIVFERREIVVRSGKGDKDRVSVLPEDPVLPLKRQIDKAKALREADLAAGAQVKRRAKPIHLSDLGEESIERG